MSEAEKRLDEILAGLDHVPPGPWSVDFSNYGDEIFYGGAGAGFWDISEIDVCTGNHRDMDARREADASMAHIARCDPDTIRTIADEFKTLKAENERLRAALKPFTDVRDQSPEGIKLISKKFPGFSPVTITVTKDQWREAIDAARSRP